jgi:quercetin dioxygenase-like cupin family protein
MTTNPLAGAEAYFFAGSTMTILVDGSETNGRYALLLARVPPGNATPPHLHDADAEIMVVLDGAITVQTNGQTTLEQPGGVAVLPPGHVHRLANDGSSDASYLLLCAPSGFEQFVRTVGRRAEEDPSSKQSMTDVDVTRLVEAAPRFGIRLTDEAALFEPMREVLHDRADEQFETLGTRIEVLAIQGEGEHAVALLRATPAAEDTASKADSSRCPQPSGGLQFFAATGTGDVRGQLLSSTGQALFAVTSTRITDLLRSGRLVEGVAADGARDREAWALVKAIREVAGNCSEHV